MCTFLENLGGTSDQFQEEKQGSPVNSEKSENENDDVERVDKDSDDATVHSPGVATSGVCVLVFGVLGGVQPRVGVLDVTLLLDPCHLCFKENSYSKIEICICKLNF